MSSVKRFYQNVNDEPAMILARKRFGKGNAFVIPLSVMFQYVHGIQDENGDVTMTGDEYLMQQSIVCANVLGLVPIVKSEIVKICDVILEGIDDLMKVKPVDLSANKLPRGDDVEIKINGESVSLAGMTH